MNGIARIACIDSFLCRLTNNQAVLSEPRSDVPIPATAFDPLAHFHWKRPSAPHGDVLQHSPACYVSLNRAGRRSNGRKPPFSVSPYRPLLSTIDLSGFTIGGRRC
jgi:hypothetical protein